MEDSKTINIRVIIALTFVHFLGDFYSSFINPLIPVFVNKFSLTLTQVGLIAGLSRFLAFIVQPSVGYVADRYRTGFFVLGGPLLAIIFISLVGIAPSFAFLIIFISLGSIGSSMFHPTVAGMIYTYAGRRFGLCMSIFNMGGTLAFAVGPLFITFFVSTYRLEASPYIMLFGLAAMPLLIKVVPHPKGEGLKSHGLIKSIREALGSAWKSIVVIWVVMVLRAFVSQSCLVFVPVLYAKKGYTLTSIGWIVSLFVVGGVISGLIAGNLSDKIGYKPVFYFSHTLAVPCIYLLLFLPGNWIYLTTFLTGFFILATMPLGVAMAQELAPRGRSMVSSLMMGLAFGTGGMMTVITGKMADIFSIREVLCVLAIIPLFTIVLIYLFPEKSVITRLKTGRLSENGFVARSSANFEGKATRPKRP